MVNVTINDEAFDAAVGDNILALARRKGAHIWFVCDGRGLCKTCECRVLLGLDNLSAPTKIEADMLTESRRKSGHRLACQTKVAISGPVSLISIAEEVRRHTKELFLGAEGKKWSENFDTWSDTLSRISLDYLRSLPSAVVHAFPQIMAKPPRPSDLEQFARDAWRVADRLLSRK